MAANSGSNPLCFVATQKASHPTYTSCTTNLGCQPRLECTCTASAGDLENSLGVLLVDFFRLMGRTLNMEEVGISCSNGGAYYNKIDAEKEQPQRMYMLSVEDPADAANDLCRGSWNILKVQSGHAAHACLNLCANLTCSTMQCCAASTQHRSPGHMAFAPAVIVDMAVWNFLTVSIYA